MLYTADISRTNPTCFLFVIDQSGSMDEKMDSGKSKAEFVADVLNKTLYQLIIRSTRVDGVRNYFDVGVIGYSSNSAGGGFCGGLSGTIVHPLSAVEANVLRVEERKKKVSDGAGGLVEQSVKFPIWFEPTNNGGTPMCKALRKTAEVLVEWCDSHQTSYPPTIIHVTDGQSTDGDPSQIAESLKLISTQDGQCLLFNLHIATDEGVAVLFPSSEDSLPDEHSKMLFRMSSGFPPHLVAAATAKGHSVSKEAGFFGYKANIEEIIDFFEIGTQAANLR
ncbi:MAG: hypothetical protein FD153_182 [Rhodospirillaceae bacterium]|nr:MAG: hypothetical protein FD153_182 [Rhodospirillaceae bacterium]